MNPYAHLDAATLNTAAAALAEAFPGAAPRCALVLGSGWNRALDAFSILRSLPFADIPGLGEAGVPGHAGLVHLAETAGVPTLVFAGRRHWYEGLGWLPVLLPVHLAHAAGARAVVLTNASGGIRPGLAPGDVVLVEDHINLMGGSPLAGPHQPAWGPRFPDLTRVYDRALSAAARAAAERVGLPLPGAVYAAVAGPSYETPAEVRALAALGADVVGMSTVPEAIAARAAGLRVLALSCVSNRAAATPDAPPPSHAEVLAALSEAAPRLTGLIAELWTELARLPDGGARP